MFFLFGWGKQTSSYFGPALLTMCPNCNNKAAWHLYKVRTWFTLFFIPVIPYNSKHLLLCEVCSEGIELYGEQVDRAKELCEYTLMFLDGEISEDEYGIHVKEIKIFE